MIGKKDYSVEIFLLGYTLICILIIIVYIFGE